MLECHELRVPMLPKPEVSTVQVSRRQTALRLADGWGRASRLATQPAVSRSPEMVMKNRSAATIQADLVG